MKKKMFGLLLILATMILSMPVLAFADNESGEAAGTTSVAYIGNVGYETLEAAVNAAKSGDTIQLGEGKYTLYQKGADVLNKNLTFVGAGTGKTTWLIGPKTPDPAKFGTEYNSDYSFDVRSTQNKETVTFKDMTLQSGSVGYLGFAGTDNTVVENCIVEGQTFYWGNTSAIFKNTVFNCPSGDYAIWTYGTENETFENCTFNSSGKIINVYADYNTGANDVTINYKNCTVVNTSNSSKPVLNINDSNKGDKKYYVNISGTNTVSGVTPDNISCSRLFGYSGRTTNNTGRSVVTIEGTTVWENGKSAVGHSHDITGGSYSNGVASGDANQYTDGYKDDAFTKKYGDWTSNDNGSKYRIVNKICNYCGYEENVVEIQLTATKTLDGMAPTGSDFTFAIKDVNGNTVQEKTNNDGDITFDTMSLSEEGTYNYTISETEGNNSQIQYDSSVYALNVIVTGRNNEDVTISYSKEGQTYEGVPTFANTTMVTDDSDNTSGSDDESSSDTADDSSTPKTGDDNNIGLWISVFSSSLLALLGLYVYGRKHRYVGNHEKK